MSLKKPPSSKAAFAIIWTQRVSINPINKHHLCHFVIDLDWFMSISNILSTYQHFLPQFIGLINNDTQLIAALAIVQMEGAIMDAGGLDADAVCIYLGKKIIIYIIYINHLRGRSDWRHDRTRQRSRLTNSDPAFVASLSCRQSIRPLVTR